MFFLQVITLFFGLLFFTVFIVNKQDAAVGLSLGFLLSCLIITGFDIVTYQGELTLIDDVLFVEAKNSIVVDTLVVYHVDGTLTVQEEMELDCQSGEECRLFLGDGAQGSLLAATVTYLEDNGRPGSMTANFK